jgi:hypothetical protein
MRASLTGENLYVYIYIHRERERERESDIIFTGEAGGVIVYSNE